MQRHLRKAAFDFLARHPMQVIAYGTLQRVFRHSAEMTVGRPGVIICIIPKGARLRDYEQAASFLLTGERQRPFDFDEHASEVRLIDGNPRPKGERSFSVDFFRTKGHVIFIAKSLDVVDLRLQVAADWPAASLSDTELS